MEENDPSPQPTTLHAFIEDNHKLLSVLGVFTGLTVFARGLPLSGAGELLSLIFLTITVLLWIELMSRYPKPASVRLQWFENMVTVVVFLTALYWLVEINALTGYLGTFFLLFMVCLWLGSLPLKYAFAKIAKYGAGRFPRWIQSPTGRWVVFAVFFAAYVVLGVNTIWRLSAVVAAQVTLPVSHTLNKLRTELSGDLKMFADESTAVKMGIPAADTPSQTANPTAARFVRAADGTDSARDSTVVGKPPVKPQGVRR